MSATSAAIDLNVIGDEATDQAHNWRRVPKVADLAEIFEPDMQVCTWQRPVDPLVSRYLDSVSTLGTFQLLETLEPNRRPLLDTLPAGAGREQLLDDIVLLTNILCDLVDCPAVGLRGTRVDHAMCPKWHVDRVPIRLLCTYGGPGTEWLEEQNVPRNELALPDAQEAAHQQAAAGDVVLLKGSLWQGNEAKGAIHRSPSLAPSAGRRTLISIDPLWRD